MNTWLFPQELCFNTAKTNRFCSHRFESVFPHQAPGSHVCQVYRGLKRIYVHLKLFCQMSLRTCIMFTPGSPKVPLSESHSMTQFRLFVSSSLPNTPTGKQSSSIMFLKQRNSTAMNRRHSISVCIQRNTHTLHFTIWWRWGM